jgi:DNA-3-methyladenine glycosylase I
MEKRCAWAESDAALRAYHDTEWGVPLHDSRALWELLMLEGFQAGLSWLVVLRKRQALRAAFRGFDPRAVAALGEADIEAMLADPGIIRSRAKIQATIGGARAYLALADRGQDFAALMWDKVGGAPLRGTGVVVAKTALSEDMSRMLKQLGFKFVGPVIVYAWMQAAGMINDHEAGCFRR